LRSSSLNRFWKAAEKGDREAAGKEATGLIYRWGATAGTGGTFSVSLNAKQEKGKLPAATVKLAVDAVKDAMKAVKALKAKD